MKGWNANESFSEFEDAVAAATAARENADYLITRNTGDYKKSPVTVIGPADFLKKYSETDT